MSARSLVVANLLLPNSGTATYVPSAPIRFPSNYVPSVDSDAVTKAYADTAGMGVPQEQMIYLSKSGCAAGQTADGRTLDTAFDNLSDALAAAGVLQQQLQGQAVFDPSTYVVVYCADAELFNLAENATVPKGVGVYAPNAIFVTGESSTISFAYEAIGITASIFSNLKFLFHGVELGGMGGMGGSPITEIPTIIYAHNCLHCSVETLNTEKQVYAKCRVDRWTFNGEVPEEISINIASPDSIISFHGSSFEGPIQIADTAQNSVVGIMHDAIRGNVLHCTVNAGTLEIYNKMPLSVADIIVASSGRVIILGPVSVPEDTGSPQVMYYYPLSQMCSLEFKDPEIEDPPTLATATAYFSRCMDISITVNGFSIADAGDHYLRAILPHQVFYGAKTVKAVAIKTADNTVILLDVAIELEAIAESEVPVLTIKIAGGITPFSNEALVVGPVVLNILGIEIFP